MAAASPAAHGKAGAATGAARPASAEAATTAAASGGARKRRDQRKRAAGRKVLWLVDLCQAKSAHHTAWDQPPRQGPWQEVEQLRTELAETRAIVDTIQMKLSDETLQSARKAAGTAEDQDTPQGNQPGTKQSESHEAENEGDETDGGDEANEEPPKTEEADVWAAAYAETVKDTLMELTDDIDRLMAGMRDGGIESTTTGADATTDEEIRQGSHQCAGTTGRFIRTDPEAGLVKISVPELGRIWLPPSTVTVVEYAGTVDDQLTTSDEEEEHDEDEEEEHEVDDENIVEPRHEEEGSGLGAWENWVNPQPVHEATCVGCL